MTKCKVIHGSFDAPIKPTFQTVMQVVRQHDAVLKLCKHASRSGQQSHLLNHVRSKFGSSPVERLSCEWNIFNFHLDYNILCMRIIKCKHTVVSEQS